MKKKDNSFDDRWEGDSWGFFGVSYASWLVLPRVQLQSMPLEWQKTFFDLVNQLDEYTDTPYPDDVRLVVSMKRNNKFIKNSIPEYRHTLLPLKK